MKNFKPLGDMISDTWKDFEKNWQNYVGISAIFVGSLFAVIIVIIIGLVVLQFAGVFGSIPFLASNDSNVSGTSGIILILVLIISFILVFGLIFFASFFINSWLLDSVITAISKKYPPDLTMTGIIKFSWPKVWKTFFALILLIIMTSIGLILLIVPGIILGIMFSQIFFLIVLEDTKIIEAFKKSYALTKGNLWTIFVYNLVAGLIANVAVFALNIVPFLGTIASLFVAIVITPLLTIFQYQIYFQLKKIK